VCAYATPHDKQKRRCAFLSSYSQQSLSASLCGTT
jgi:hypothetical protein